MIQRNVLHVKNRNELRAWLEVNHNVERECWVLVKRGKPQEGDDFWYLDAVEEAMCFGWIDSTCMKAEDGFTTQRLSPRSKRSAWTELNKERCRRMEKMGRMSDAGRAVLPKMSISEFKIDEEIIHAMKENPVVWNNFNTFPPLYQRIRIDTIQSYKKDKELFKKRLEKFLMNTEKGELYGEWNDYGRLNNDSM